MPGAINYVRMNLASAIFPFYTEAAGRTIVIPQSDENFDRYNAANTVPDKGVAQVYYMHNVMPIAGGYQSVGYNTIVAGLSGATDFDQAFTLQTPDLAKHILVPVSGKNYIYTGNKQVWTAHPSPPNAYRPNGLVTTAFVQGQTYINYEGYGTFIYNPTTDTLDRQTLTTLDDTKILGICASAGYLIAWDGKTVYWSSVTNPLDFYPSIQTGAGSLTLNDAKGGINFCLSINNGFLVYCSKNVLGASYSSNVNYPFIFAEIPDSGGCNDPDRVAWQSNIDTHLAYTTSGIQLFNKNNATGIMPEFADFLASLLYEDYDDTTDILTQTHLGAPVAIKMSAVSDRYLVMSYGPDQSNFTYALVMDTVLNRYGRLKITHRSVVDFNNPAPSGNLTYAQLTMTVASLGGTVLYEDFSNGRQLQIQSIPKKTFGFLQQDGTIQLVDFNLSEATANGVFLIGKFQHIRNNVIVHQLTEVESSRPGLPLSVSVRLTLDGKTLEAPLPTNVNFQSKGTSRTGTYARRASGVNFSICIKGAFNLTSLVTKYTVGGSR